MDDKKLLKSLSDITSQLQNIAKGLGVSTGVGKAIQKSNKLSKDDLAKNKEIAKITAEEYKKTLGLNFKDSDNVDKIAKRFKVTFDVATTIRLMYNIRDHLKEFKDKLLKSTKTNVSTTGTSDKMIKSLGLEDFKSEVIGNIRAEESHRLFVQEAWENLFRNLGVMIDNTKKEKKKESDKGGLADKLKNVAGLALIGVGIFLIVQALINSGQINLGNTLKVLAVVSAFLLLFYAVSDKAARIKASAIGFAILSATILLLIIPTMKILAKMPLGEYINGLIKFGIIMFGLIKLVKLMEKIKSSDVIKSTLGIGLLTLVVGLVVIPLLKTIADIPFAEMIEGLFKFAFIIASMYGLLKLMSKIDGSEVIKSTLGMGLLSAILALVVLPSLMSIANYDFEKILKGLAYVAVVVGAMGLIIKITRKLFSEGIKETLVGMLAIVGLSFILGYLADNLNKFADMDWGKIGKSLALSVAAIAVFGLVVFGIGTIVANPFVALFLAVGAVAVISLSFLLGVIADSLKKFNDVDGLQLIIVGEGLKYLGIGLVSFLGGMISGAIAGAIALITEFFGIDIPAQIKKFEAIDGEKLIYVGEGVRLLGEGLVPFLKGMVSGVGGSVVGKLASFFGLDPVSEIKEFEKIDADKISVLGLGLKNMGDGLRMLSSGIDLSGITAQIISLILPLVLCTKALDGFNRSLNRNMPSAELTQVYKMKVDTENSIQNAILETNKQELAIQQEQLMELQKSNELLKYIADNISSGSASKGGNQIINQNKPAESVTTSNFTTKNNYMNHMKLTSMSMG